MTTPIDSMPPLPEVSFLGDDISYGYDREDMHAYAQAHAAQQCAELAAKLAVADARVASLTQPSAVVQEPVAWAKRINIRTEFEQYCFSASKYGDYQTPLYDHLAAKVEPTAQPEPPFGDKRKAAMAVYTPPFKYQYGYIYDAQNLMVADNGGINDAQSVEGAIAARVRGWGRLGYLPNGAELQDEIGRMMADALNALYTHPPSKVEPTAQPESGKTGWPPGMLQDDCKGLSKWLSNTPNAKQDARDAATPPPVAKVEPTAQLPVAWAKRINIGTEFEQYCFSSSRYGDYQIPLYAHPPSAAEPTAQPDEWIKKAIALCQHWANCARDLPSIEEYRSAKSAAIKHLQTAQIAPPPVAGDARRYEYMIDCDAKAASKYLPSLDVQAYKAKLRAKHDAAIAAGGKP